MTKNNKAPVDDGFSLISARKLFTLYAAMLDCRRIAERSRSGRKKVDAVLGHEAAVVGSAIDLFAHDTVAPSLWPDAAYKAVNSLVSIASHISVAARSALANKNDRKVTMLFSNGKHGKRVSWLKALNLASGHNLPMLFVSLGGTVDEEALPTKSEAFPRIAVDGNDVVAVYRVASEAITHARKGHGPTLIDCRHSIPGDPLERMQEYLRGKGLDPEQL